MRVVILGTGTEVGKTYVTACLARGLAEHLPVVALKPIESGVDGETPGDAGTIAAPAGHAPVLSRWRFRRPVSPHLAARDGGTTVDVADVVAWVAEHEGRAKAVLSLVELAGGAFSPLAPGCTNVDLARALDPAIWLLVAPDSLGVLHDLTATLRALPRLPDAVLLCGARATDQSSGTNALELSRLGITEVLEVVAPGQANCPRTVDWLLRRKTYMSGKT